MARGGGLLGSGEDGGQALSPATAGKGREMRSKRQAQESCVQRAAGCGRIPEKEEPVQRSWASRELTAAV